MLSVGQLIGLWRIERGYSQAMLSRATNILQPNLSRIEQDKSDITLSTLKTIAGALNLQVRQLIEGAFTPSDSDQFQNLSREDLEKLADTIVNNEKESLSPHLMPLVEIFKILTESSSNKKYGSKKILWAWIKAKSLLSKNYINALLAKIDEARQLA